MYAVDIEALQLELLRYPGIELDHISEQGQIVHEDEETGDELVLDLLTMNLLLLVFKGPATGVSDQPTKIVAPVSAEAMHNPAFRCRLVDRVADDFERAIQDHAVE